MHILVKLYFHWVEISFVIKVICFCLVSWNWACFVKKSGKVFNMDTSVCFSRNKKKSVVTRWKSPCKMVIEKLLSKVLGMF